MQAQLKTILRYLLSFFVGGALFWFVYKDQSLDNMKAYLADLDYRWVFLSVIISFVSHFSRGWRWAIALKPFGYQVNIIKSFLAVMAGYMANLFIPRMGEFVRCGVLKRMEKVPMKMSFGAVVAERAVDVIILMLLAVLVLLVEFEKIGGFLLNQLSDSSTLIADKLLIISILGFLGSVFLVVLYLKRAHFQKLPFYDKIKGGIQGFQQGLLSIQKLSLTQKTAYFLHSIGIWVMYFLMAYVLFLAKGDTAQLSWICGLTVVVMGGIGMAIPTPGGTGSYHFFVANTFIAYGLSESIGNYFAFLMHTSQVISQLFLGGIALIISLFFKKNNLDEKEEDLLFTEEK